MKADHELMCDMEEMSAKTLVRDAHAMLNRYRLSDAEELFHRVLELPDYTVHQHYRHLVTALLGLSEVYTKRGRSMRNNEMEWHRMYLHAISAKRKAIDVCKEALDYVKDNQEVTWFKENQAKVEHSLNVIEEVFVKSIQDRTIEFKEKDVKKKESDDNFDPDNTVDAENLVLNNSQTNVNKHWLEHFITYYKDKCASSRLLKWQSREELVIEDTEEEKILEPEVKVEKHPINYAKLQSAIQKIVKRISEMGSIHIHPNMTPEEKLNLLSPMSGEYNILDQFAKAMHKDDSSEDSSVEGDDPITPMAEGTTGLEEALAAGRPKLAKIGAHEPSPTKEEGAFSWTDKKEDTLSISSAISNLSSSRWQSLENVHSQYIQPNRSRPLQEGEILTHGVLRVWRCYDQSQEQLEKEDTPRPGYSLNTYEEVSPLTQVVGLRRSQTEHDLDDDFAGLPDRTPVSEMNLNITLAHAIGNMASQLKENKYLKEATELYKMSLGIIKENMSGRNNSALLTVVGGIIQNLGLIKCTQGDLVGGSRLMEEAISMYQESGQRDSDLMVVRVWYKLGEAYLADQWKEMTFSEHVMKSVQDVLQRDFKREFVDEPEDLSDDVSDSDSSDGEESYSVCTEEAITCYYNALGILRKIKPTGENYTMFLVEVLTKLGDCMIMVGNFDQATLRYEEALGLFKNIIGSSTLHLNAHVLSMLATSNFLLSNYPKAVSMYECANLLAQHLYGGELATFDVAFTLTMLGICHYCMKHYHKCIAWCLKAFEIYSFLYKEKIHSIPSLQRWFVTQTLYTLGYSYGTLNFHDKAIHYLKLSRNMLLDVEEFDLKQCVRILKALADVCVTIDKSEESLEYYSEALDMSKALGNEKSTTALQNQLLNRMASVHVSSKQYDTAAEYLRQALDYQKNVENNIKDDMVNILRQLGLTYTMSGDMDKAIECYSECMDAYSEMPGSHNSEMAQLLGTLGTLYHVKACLQDENDHMMDLLLIAEKHYQEALELDSSSSVCVQYANYLYQQAQAADALEAMLPYVHLHTKHDSDSILYNGVEQAVLPEHLQQEVDDTDEVALEAKVFAQFLAVLCYKQLNMIKDAEDCLIGLLKNVSDSVLPLNHSILGYSFLEMNMHEEAARSFHKAASLSHDNNLAITNYWLSLGTLAFTTFAKGMWNIHEHCNKDKIFQQWLSEMPLLPVSDRSTMDCEGAQAAGGIRDSGYYDHGIMGEKEERAEEVYWDAQDEYQGDGPNASAHEDWVQQSETVETPASIIQAMIAEHNREEEAILEQHDEQHMDRGYYSSECLERQGLDDVEDREAPSAKWMSEESMETLTGVPEEIEYDIMEEADAQETVETPDAILEVLRQQQEQALEREVNLYGALLDLGQDHQEEDEDEVTLTEDNNFLMPESTTRGSWRSSVPDLHNNTYTYRSGLSPATSETLLKHGISPASSETRLPGLSVATSEIIQRARGMSPSASRTRLTSSSSEGRLSQTRYLSTENLRLETDSSIQYESEDTPTDTEEWVIEEVEVETPMSIMQVLGEMRTSDASSQGDSSSVSSQGDLVRLDIETPSITINDTIPSQYDRSYSSSRETSRSRESTPYSTSSSSYHSVSSYVRLTDETIHLSEAEEDNLELIEEEQVETPVAVLEAIKRKQETRELQQRNQNDEIPMETSPDREIAPEPYTSWSSRSYSSRPANYYSSRDQTQDRYSSRIHSTDPYSSTSHTTDHFSSHHSEVDNAYKGEEEEVVWVVEEAVETPTAILQAIHDNNNGSSSPVPTSSTTESFTSEDTDKNSVINKTWTAENIRYPTTTLKAVEQNEQDHALQKDRENGNHGTSVYYQSASTDQHGEEQEEEKWQTWESEREEKWQIFEEEEVIETPPEILQALLRAQQVQ